MKKMLSTWEYYAVLMLWGVVAYSISYSIFNNHYQSLLVAVPPLLSIIAIFAYSKRKHVMSNTKPTSAPVPVPGYTTEIGGYIFTEEQWDVISTYAKGFSITRAHQFSRMQEAVADFHTAMGQPVGNYPAPLSQDRVPVRVELIREEFEDELIPALQNGDLVETVDACVDLLYVVFGLMVELGVNASPVFEEVHGSNMSKFGEDGKPLIAGPNDPDGVFEGRVKKGPHYYRPQIKSLLESKHADLGNEYS